MSIQYDMLLQQVMALPSKDRASLAKTVIDSLPDDDPEDVRAAWIEEIDLRMAAIERGEAGFRPGDQVIADLRRKLSS